MEPSSLLPKVLLEEDDIDVDLDIDPPSSPEPIKDPPQMDLMALLGSKDSRKESEIQANSVVQEELSDSEDSSDESEEGMVMPLVVGRRQLLCSPYKKAAQPFNS